MKEILYGNNGPHRLRGNRLFASYNVDHPSLNLLGIHKEKTFYSQADRKGGRGGVYLGPDRKQMWKFPPIKNTQKGLKIVVLDQKTPYGQPNCKTPLFFNDFQIKKAPKKCF